MSAAFEIAAFGVLAFVAVAGALGMTTTMSMFRSGIFLMASFIGVAGLFILLSADLIGLLQVMMYIGGFLIMILFMVLVMHDPGGAIDGRHGHGPAGALVQQGARPAPAPRARSRAITGTPKPHSILAMRRTRATAPSPMAHMLTSPGIRTMRQPRAMPHNAEGGQVRQPDHQHEQDYPRTRAWARTRWRT